MKWHTWLVYLKLLASIVSMSNGQQYLPTISVAGGYVLSKGTAPGPGPTPPSPSPFNCLYCRDKGWLGDGTTKQDCPHCDQPWKESGLVLAPSPSLSSSGDVSAAQLLESGMEASNLPSVVSEDPELAPYRDPQTGGLPPFNSFQAAVEQALSPRSILLLIHRGKDQEYLDRVSKFVTSLPNARRFVYLPLHADDEWNVEATVGQHWQVPSSAPVWVLHVDLVTNEPRVLRSIQEIKEIQ